jgi:hypothetical protein
MAEAVQKCIDNAQDKDLEAIMIVGLDKNGGLMIESSVNNVALMHWMLNKSIFDINVFESNNKGKKEEEAA